LGIFAQVWIAMNGDVRCKGLPMTTFSKAMKDATERVQTAMPATSGFVSRFVYTTCYFSSFGIVLPTLYLAYSVPGLEPAAEGLLDGAASACGAVNKASQPVADAA
jgi:hypothetical protein